MLVEVVSYACCLLPASMKGPSSSLLYVQNARSGLGSYTYVMTTCKKNSLQSFGSGIISAGLGWAVAKL